MSGEPNICLVCGRPAPCMTDDEGLANDGPGSPCTFEFPLSPPPMTGLPVEVDQLRDKIEGLEADLFLAVSTAYNRGAVDWTRLNYPEWFERLKVNAPALLAQPVLGEGEAREPVKMLVDADWLRRKVEADPEAEVEVRPGQGGMVKALADALDALLHEDSEKSEQDRLLTRLKARVQLEAAWDLLARVKAAEEERDRLRGVATAHLNTAIDHMSLATSLQSEVTRLRDVMTRPIHER